MLKIVVPFLCFFIVLFGFMVFASQSVSVEASVQKGRKVYLNNCASCHGVKADGNGPAASVMSPKPRDLVKGKFIAGESYAEIMNTITKGLKGTAMPGFFFIPELDRKALTEYILSIRKKK